MSHKDPCGNDHDPMMIENTMIGNLELQSITKLPWWTFEKANWKSYKKLCLTLLIPETITNQEESIIHFTNTLITIANKMISKTITIDQTICIETLIREAFIIKEHLVAVFFDLEKAYDTSLSYGTLKGLALQGRLSIFIKHFQKTGPSKHE